MEEGVFFKKWNVTVWVREDEEDGEGGVILRFFVFLGRMDNIEPYSVENCS